LVGWNRTTQSLWVAATIPTHKTIFTYKLLQVKLLPLFQHSFQT
jgi:hypothetical protein